MILTCIGTGTAAPEPDRVCAGYLLESHDLRLLMDCGPGVVHAMARRGIDWQTIDHLLITHFHNDHIGDVPMLFFAWKYGMRPARLKRLTVIGPTGTEKLLDRMGDVFGSHLHEPGFAVRVIELRDGDELRLSDSLRLRVCHTAHTPGALAYRIDGDARSFCYTGDTGPSEEVAVFAQSADVLLTECSVPDDEAMPMHMTPSQVAALARVALPRRLLVTHVYPQLPRAYVPELIRQAGWPGHVELPGDGDRFEI